MIFSAARRLGLTYEPAAGMFRAARRAGVPAMPNVFRLYRESDDIEGRTWTDGNERERLSFTLGPGNGDHLWVVIWRYTWGRGYVVRVMYRDTRDPLYGTRSRKRSYHFSVQAWRAVTEEIDAYAMRLAIKGSLDR